MPYVYLRVKTNFPEDRWIQATEVRPTAPEVVHHVLVFASGEDGIKREQAGALAAYVPGNTFVEFPGRSEKTSCRGDSPFPDALYPDGKRLPTGRKSDSASQKPLLTKSFELCPSSIVVSTYLPMPPITLKPLREPFRQASSCGPSCPTCTSGERLSSTSCLRRTEKGKRCLRFRYDFNWQLRYELKEPRAWWRGGGSK